MAKILIPAFLILSVVLYASEAEELVDSSHDKLRKGDYEGAVSDLQKAISLDGTLAVAYNNLGLAFFHQGKLKEAVQQFTKAIALADNESVTMLAYFNRANAYRFLKEYDKSIRDCDKVLEIRKKSQTLSDDDKETHLMRGWNYLARHNYEKAKADFEKAVDINKRYVLAHNYLGIAYLEQNDFERAIDCFSRAIEMTPDDQHFLDAYACRGQAYLATNQLTRAIVDFTVIIEKSPRSPVGLERRADTYFLKGSFDRSVRDYTAAIESGGATPALCLKLFGAAQRLDQAAPALESFRKFASAVKDGGWLKIVLDFYQGGAGEAEVLAAAASEDKIQESQNLCIAHYYMGAFYMSKKEIEKAKEHFGKALGTGKKFLIEYIFASWELQELK